MKGKFRKLSKFVATTLAVMMAVSSVPIQVGAAAPAGRRVLRWAETVDIRSINPFTGNWATEDTARVWTGGSLYRATLDPDTLEFMYLPSLAADFPVQVDDYGRVWQISIRPDARWANGSPINADTFMYTFRMALCPDMMNPLASWYALGEIEILNGVDFVLQNLDGHDPVEWEEVGFRKIDDLTIEIETTQRFNQIDIVRHFQGLRPVYEPLFEAGMNEDRTMSTYATSVDSFMSSGPFILQSWDLNAERVYVANPDYPLAHLFHIDEVRISIVPDIGTILQLFEAGEIDFMENLTIDNYLRFRDDPRLRHWPSNDVSLLAVNMAHEYHTLLSNLNFRRALFWSLDREELAELVNHRPWTSLLHMMAGGFPDEGILYHDLPEVIAMRPENYGFDPDRARAYLALALEEEGLERAVMTHMITDVAVVGRRKAEWYQASLHEIFGDQLQFIIEPVAAAAFGGIILGWEDNPNTWESAWISWMWGATNRRPNLQFQFFTSTGQLNVTDFDSAAPELPAMYTLSLSEEKRMDQAALIALTIEMEQIFNENVLAIPAYNVMGRSIFSERITLLVDEFDPQAGFALMQMQIAPLE